MTTAIEKNAPAESPIKNFNRQSLYIIPFGGVEEFGMNVTGYYFNQKLILVDCGLMFADATKLGVDGLYPDLSPHLPAFNGVSAYFITHGHEDHVGALAYYWREWPAPIYATAWTVEIIKAKFAQWKLKTAPQIIVTKPKDRIRFGDFDVEWVHVNHSIPMACALFFRTPAGNVFHTGDFKFDSHPVCEPPLDKKDLQVIAKGGVDLLLADSTGSHSAGEAGSESSVLGPLKKCVQSASGAVVVATFSSHLWRFKIILQIAQALKKKVFVCGAGMERMFNYACNLKLMSKEELKTIVGRDKVAKCERSKLIVLASGCQAEQYSALSRIIRGEHKDFSFQPNDTLILSSRTIPGNEKAVLNAISNCRKLAVEVITPFTHPGIHVSGHGNQEDLQKLIKALKPSQYMPIHGTYLHKEQNAKVAESVGLHPEQLLQSDDGGVVCLNKRNAKVLETLKVNITYVDAFSRLPLDPRELKKRLSVAELGLMMISGVFAIKKNQWLKEPEVTSLGIPDLAASGYKDWQESLQKEIKQAFQSAIQPQMMKPSNYDQEAVNEYVRLQVRRFVFTRLNKKIIMHVRLHLI